MGFLETSSRLRTDFFEAMERFGRITRSGIRWYSMAGMIATSTAPERSASAHWDGTVNESSYLPRSGPCVKPRTSGAVFRYSTMEMRTGFTSIICLERNLSIANAACPRPLRPPGGRFIAFEAYEKFGVSPILNYFAILVASATIKTLLFNLLECRNRYDNEV